MDFKRGDTFKFSQLLPTTWPAGTWSAACRLFDEKANQSYVVTASITSVTVEGVPRLLLSLYAAPAATATWPAGRRLKGDVQFTDSSATPDPFVISTKDFLVNVLADRA